MTLPTYTRAQQLPAILQRIAILMGPWHHDSALQTPEAQHRGERLPTLPTMKGNNELLRHAPGCDPRHPRTLLALAPT